MKNVSAVGQGHLVLGHGRVADGALGLVGLDEHNVIDSLRVARDVVQLALLARRHPPLAQVHHLVDRTEVASVHDVGGGALADRARTGGRSTPQVNELKAPKTFSLARPGLVIFVVPIHLNLSVDSSRGEIAILNPSQRFCLCPPRPKLAEKHFLFDLHQGGHKK